MSFIPCNMESSRGEASFKFTAPPLPTAQGSSAQTMEHAQIFGTRMIVPAMSDGPVNLVNIISTTALVTTVP